MLRETRNQVYEAIRSVAALAGLLFEKPPRHGGQPWFTWSQPYDAFLLQKRFDDPLRIGLRLRDLTLLLVDESVREVPLRGSASLDTVIDVEELDTIARWYRDAAGILVRKQIWSLEGSGLALDPRRCNLLMWIDQSEAGFLPGDDAVDEPYWWVFNPMVKRPLAPLPAGEWVEGEKILAILKGERDTATIETFLDRALG